MLAFVMTWFFFADAWARHVAAWLGFVPYMLSLYGVKIHPSSQKYA